ncbi:hypothetical protein TYRP_011467 [Tyrophagus putrescentiae]|nr:hypothetical protein TYRP_011467 [Tyrophagus putrescentiae]
MESEQKENDFAVEDYIIAAAAGSQSFNFEGSADRPLMELQNVLILNTPLQSSSASSASSSSTSTFTSIISLSPFTNLKAYIFKFSNPAVTLLPANQSNVGPFSLLPDELMTKKLAESFDHAVEYLGYLVVAVVAVLEELADHYGRPLIEAFVEFFSTLEHQLEHLEEEDEEEAENTVTLSDVKVTVLQLMRMQMLRVHSVKKYQ